MIKPIGVMTNSISPISFNAQSVRGANSVQKAYNDTVNYARLGEKLNLNCSDNYTCTGDCNGKRLNILA